MTSNTHHPRRRQRAPSPAAVALARSGFSQDTLAATLGVTASQVSYYLSGHTTPSAKLRPALEDLVGAETADNILAEALLSRAEREKHIQEREAAHPVT